MWTFLPKQNVDNFLQQYQELDQYFNDIKLLEVEDAYFLPRLFSTNYPSQSLVKFETDSSSDYPEINNYSFKGKLRPEQEPIVNKVIDLYKKFGFVNGIVKARPGLGKTVLAVYLASQLKIKTCIIVDNSNLMKQWIKAFVEFTDLDPSDIGLIQQKHFSVDKPVIIAMAQTLVSRVKDIKKNFLTIDEAKIGLVVYDEVHATSSAPVFSRVSLLFRTKNVLGLSATPFQTGAAEILMKNTVGNIIYETKEYDLTPEYRLIYYKSEIDAKKVNMLNHISDYLQRKALYNKFVVDSKNYINLIVNQTKEMLAIGHKIIILCFTKNQVTTISDALTNVEIINKKFYGEERDIEYNENVLVATYSFAGKGFDYKSLSCLILACPLAGKKSLIQVIGRILRSDVDKIKPMVIDLADMSVPGFTLPEVKLKKNVVSNEFNCEIKESAI